MWGLSGFEAPNCIRNMDDQSMLPFQGLPIVRIAGHGAVDRASQKAFLQPRAVKS